MDAHHLEPRGAMHRHLRRAPPLAIPGLGGSNGNPGNAGGSGDDADATTAPTTPATTVRTTAPATTPDEPTTQRATQDPTSAPVTVVTTTTTTSRSTSSTSSTSTRSSAAATSIVTSFTVVPGLSQSIPTLSQSTLSASNSAAAANGSNDDGPGAGEVVGIVAGALLGVVVISAIIGFLFKKKCSKQEYDESPFDKDDFRRSSVMLDDTLYADDNARSHSPQMSELAGMAPLPPGLARNGTMLSRNGTIQSPRPPSTLVNHFQQQQMMPSFSPGQIVNAQPNFYPGMPTGQHPLAPPVALAYGGPNSVSAMDMYGGYPVPLNQQRQLDQNIPGYGRQTPVARGLAAPSSGLQRQASGASAYSAHSNGASRDEYGNAISFPQSTSPTPIDGRPLSDVREDDGDEFENDRAPTRSGTPLDVNPQYVAHGSYADAEDEGHVVSHPGLGNFVFEGEDASRPVSEGNMLGMYDDVVAHPMMSADPQRTLSVRNGGLNDSSAYSRQGRPLSTASDGYGGI